MFIEVEIIITLRQIIIFFFFFLIMEIILAFVITTSFRKISVNRGFCIAMGGKHIGHLLHKEDSYMLRLRLRSNLY